MTVESTRPTNPDDVVHHDLESKGNHPSSLLSSATDNNELRNVSFKAVIASKYTLLNGTLLELLGVIETKLDGSNSIAEEQKDASEYRSWLGRLEGEYAQLEQEQRQNFALQDDPLNARLAHLNSKLEIAITEIPSGQKIIPKQEPYYTVVNKGFKSKKVSYQRASTLEREEEVAKIDDVLMADPETLPLITEVTLDDAPIIGSIADAPELAHISTEHTIASHTDTYPTQF